MTELTDSVVWTYDGSGNVFYIPGDFQLGGFALPQPVGYYKFGDVQFYLRKKPRLLTRFMMRHFFELEWVDE